MHDRIDDCLAVDRPSDIAGLAAEWANNGPALRNVNTKAAMECAERDLEIDRGPPTTIVPRTESRLDLPDLAAFEDRFGVAIAQAAGSGKPISVLWIDFDGFEGENDPTGVALRRVAADRLRFAARGSFVARIGKDAFAIIVEDECQPSASEDLARRLRGAFDAPVSFDGRAFDAGLTIGVAVRPSDRRFAAVANAAS